MCNSREIITKQQRAIFKHAQLPRQVAIVCPTFVRRRRSTRVSNMAVGTRTTHTGNQVDRSPSGIGERVLSTAFKRTDSHSRISDVALVSTRFARSTKIIIPLDFRVAKPSRWATYQQVRLSTSILSASIPLIDKLIMKSWVIKRDHRWRNLTVAKRSNDQILTYGSNACSLSLTFLATTLWTACVVCASVLRVYSV